MTQVTPPPLGGCCPERPNSDSPPIDTTSCGETELVNIDRYLRAVEANGARPATVYTSQIILRRIVAHVGPLEHATVDDISGWWESRAHLAPHTRRGELSRLQSWNRWAVEVGLIDVPNCRRLKPPRAPRPAPRPIGEAELAQALEIASGRVRSWMLLAAYGGLRACECAWLRPEDLTETELVVRAGKGGHAAVLPAHPLLAEVRVDWGDECQPHTVSHHVNRFLHSIGIGASMHKLRARFATQVYDRSGGDLRLTQELLRHASPTTTAIYVGWSRDAARAAVEAL